MERPRRSFTEEYKHQAVELVMSSGRSITSVAKELGLRNSVLRRWVDKLRQKPTSAAWRAHHAGAADVGGARLFGTRPAAPGERTAAHGARHFKKVDRDLCRDTDMSFRFIEDHRDSYPVRLMCAVLEVSPAGYYAWRERPVSERTKSSAALLAAIRQVHQDSCGRYGSPRVHAALHRQGRGASRGRIERLMHRNGIRAIMAPPRRVRTTDSRHGLPIAPNLIARDFRRRPRTRSGSPTSPTSRPPRAGSIWPRSWICSGARSSAGRCAITCRSNSRPRR